MAARSQPAAASSREFVAVRSRRPSRSAYLVVGATITIALTVLAAAAPARGVDDATPTPGIPSTVRGIVGDGGLELEADLAVGPASLAIVNPSGAFVITAADGVYHRLRLPGFDPTAYNDEQPGLALSPDGTRLAYGWRGTGAAGPRVGTRILDLRTGSLKKIPGYKFDSKASGFSTYGYGWSPNSRYLVFETLTQTPEVYPRHVYGGVDAVKGDSAFGGFDPSFFTCHDACKPMALVNPRRMARFDPDVEGGALVFGGVFSGGGVAFEPFPLPGEAEWDVGRMTPDGRRVLLQPVGVGAGLLLVTDSGRDPLSHNPRPFGRYSATPLPLDSAQWPDGAKIDVLGWVGPDHVLAMVNRGTGSDTWEPEGDLALVDVSSAAETTSEETPISLEVVGHVEAGDPGSTYSFATDYATVEAPTQNFDEATPSPQSNPDANGALTSVDSADSDDASPSRLLVYAGIGLAVVLLLAALLVHRAGGATRSHRERAPYVGWDDVKPQASTDRSTPGWPERGASGRRTAS